MIWMTPKEAALYAKCAEETVRVALREGDLEGRQPKAHGRWLTCDEWLDQWIINGSQGKSARKAA